jgi:hypothetical protein
MQSQAVLRSEDAFSARLGRNSKNLWKQGVTTEPID